MFQKNRIYPILLILAMYIVWQIRNSDKEMLVVVAGSTMGTTYSIKYFDRDGTVYKHQIDSVLVLFNQSLSTYIKSSEVSTFNQQSSFTFVLPYFRTVLQKSREIFDITNGAFDPTVYPLVNAWGFGPGERTIPDSVQVDSLLTYVGFDKIEFDEHNVYKTQDDVQLDFSAIAKGFGADVVGGYLDELDIEHYFIEIGGEVKTKGLNEGKMWRVGIEDPLESIDRNLSAIVEISNRSMATSGNYRNFYELEGTKYAHTIDPKTGFPVKHSLLSASVFAQSCMEADAYATAFMVMGLEESKELLKSMKEIEVYFIYSDGAGNFKTYSSIGLADQIQEIDN